MINLPCLNFFDKSWFSKKIKKFKNIFTLDDHNISGGLGDMLFSFLAENDLVGNKNLKNLVLRIILHVAHIMKY